MKQIIQTYTQVIQGLPLFSGSKKKSNTRGEHLIIIDLIVERLKFLGGANSYPILKLPKETFTVAFLVHDEFPDEKTKNKSSNSRGLRGRGWRQRRPSLLGLLLPLFLDLLLRGLGLRLAVMLDHTDGTDESSVDLYLKSRNLFIH